MSTESPLSSERNLDWKEFVLSAEAGPEFEFNRKDLLGSETQQVPFSDRLAQRFFSGTVPLFLLSLSALSLSTWNTGFGMMALNVPCALLMAWLLKPFVRSASKTSLNKYFLLVFPVMAISWVTALLPQGLLYVLKGHTWQFEFVPQTLQENLESSLTPYHGLGYLLLAIVFAAIQMRFQNQYYWIEVPRSTKLAIFWRALFWILPTLLLVVFLSTESTSSKVELDWSNAQEAQLQKRPLIQLPLDGESRYWRSLLKRTAPTFTFEEWRDIEGIPFVRAQKPSEESFDVHSPDSGYELVACFKYYRLLRTHSPEPMTQFQGVKLIFLAGCSESESVNLQLLLKSLGQSSVSGEKLETWKSEIDKLRAVRLTREMELDLVAHRQLSELEVPNSVSYGGWSTGGYLYDRNFKAMKGKDLEILGQSIPVSPTHFYFSWQQARLRSQWLDFKRILLRKPLAEQAEILNAQRSTRHFSSFARKFWNWLPSGNSLNTELRDLKTGEAILAIRAYALKERKLPDSLQGVVEAPDLYRWKIENGVGILTNKDSGRAIQVLGAKS